MKKALIVLIAVKLWFLSHFGEMTLWNIVALLPLSTDPCMSDPRNGVAVCIDHAIQVGPLAFDPDISFL